MLDLENEDIAYHVALARRTLEVRACKKSMGN
jgi:hypothetical protein